MSTESQKTSQATLRPVVDGDLDAVADLAVNAKCLQWGGLGSPTAKQLAERWQQPQILRSFLTVAESASGLQAYCEVYQAMPQLGILRGFSSDLDAAEAMIEWTSDKAASLGMTLQTSLIAKEAGRTILPHIVDRPLYTLLIKTGFVAVSTTRTMRLSTERIPDPQPLPQPYRLADFKESLLPSLVDTYFAAWPKDYYGEDDRDDIADYFRQVQFDNLRLALADNGDVVGYFAASRTSKLGVIDEVAVHPAHRRKGLGESLVRTAIQILKGRTIDLVVLDDNPVRHLYERLGFSVLKESLDLVLTSG